MLQHQDLNFFLTLISLVDKLKSAWNKDKAQGCTLDDVECILKLKITSTDFLQENFHKLFHTASYLKNLLRHLLK
jgi:hypothetical protein